MRRLTVRLATLGLILAVLVLGVGCFDKTPTDDKTDNTTETTTDDSGASTPSLIDLCVTEKNLGILQDLEKKTTSVYEVVTGPPESFNKLLWSVDNDGGSRLDVDHKKAAGQYTQLGESSGYWGECVAAVKQLSRYSGYAGKDTWLRGRKVMDGGVESGTVIATFMGTDHTFDPSGTSHTAVFKGYVFGKNSAKTGFEVWDQNWYGQGLMGKHTMSAGAADANSDANQYYVVQVSSAKQPAPPASTSIAYGQGVTGQIDTASDYEDWEFSGAAGDIVTIHVVQEGGASLHPTLDLFDTSNTRVEDGDLSSDYDESYIKNYKLGYSGVHTIRVNGYNSSTGGYRLSLVLKPSPGSIAYGQEVTGQIDFGGDYRDWKFTGTAGDIVTIHVVQEGGASVHPTLDLFDTSNTRVEDGDLSSDYDESYIKNYKLGYSGVYTVRVNGYNSSTGGYRLSLVLKPSPGSIAYGQEVTGQIDFGGDYRDWKFTGTAGDIVTIHVVQEGGASLHPTLDLFDTSNTRVEDGDLSSDYDESYINNYKLDFSGVYTIRVNGYNSSTGGYRLQLSLESAYA